MSNQNAKGKLKYEAPVLASLGAMGKGAGVDCSAGSNAVGLCHAGTSASPGDCTSGTTAGSFCTSVGNSAQTACTAGNTAVSANCSGGSLPGAGCTAGTTP